LKKYASESNIGSVAGTNIDQRKTSAQGSPGDIAAIALLASIFQNGVE